MSSEKISLEKAALKFEPQQLTRARELRGTTKSHLASLVDKTPSAITQFEKGIARPDPRTLAKLSLALAFPVEFFARKPLLVAPGVDECHFRSLRSASQGARRRAIRLGELVHEISVLLQLEGIEFPAVDLSDVREEFLSAEFIESLAVRVRREWGLGLGPLPRLVALLESKGIRILPLTDACKEVEAFSMWHDGVPIIFVSMDSPASRIHFDLAHELGHLLMHADAAPGSRQLENEADQFASAFLMPKDSFAGECPSRWRIDDFISLKKRWFVSLQALLVRSHRLGRLSTASYRRAFVQLSRLGMRRREVAEWEFEAPQVLRQALRLVQDDLPLREVARRLALHESHLAQVLEPIVFQNQTATLASRLDSPGNLPDEGQLPNNGGCSLEPGSGLGE